ncbi:MAG: hypothetical protein ACFFDI_11705 [Promethearchaeota archaeon]
MKYRLSRQELYKIQQAKSLEKLSFKQLATFFRQEEGVTNYKPDGLCQIDPRTGEKIIFNSARARRPHDNKVKVVSQNDSEDVSCAICNGETTSVIDVVDLTEGFTFINKNLFPAVYPFKDIINFPSIEHQWDETSFIKDIEIYGLHFLQWTSSFHNKDWHNMALEDRIIVMKRLASLEKYLLTESKGYVSTNRLWGDSDHSGFVSIIKNHGRLVGGSLSHGHQQIMLTNVMPRVFYNNWRFQQENGITFSSYMLQNNPYDLLIRDYGEAVLIIPYFMRRPYEMMLILKNTSKKYIHQLSEAEMTAVVEGWHDATRSIYEIMPRIARELAYNIITHIGPGAGIYFEFRPYTQETGGFEHLGFLICNENPKDAAVESRRVLVKLGMRELDAIENNG